MEPTKNPANPNTSTGSNNFNNTNSMGYGNTPSTPSTSSSSSASNNFGNLRPSLDPVFQGMPKPGQSLASVPKVSNAPTVSPVPADSPFQRSAPSAFDKLMNPNLDKMDKPVAQPVSSGSQFSSNPTSSFKPYTPAPISSPVFTPSTAPVSPASVPYPTSSSFAPSPSSSSIYAERPVVSSTVKTSTPPVLNAPNFQSAKPVMPMGGSPKKSQTTLVISAIAVVLLLLAGGGYYWYSFIYMPAQSKNATKTNAPSSNQNQGNSAPKPSSVFPTAATKPVTSTVPVVTTKPATPAKVTQVTTPFNSDQRAAVSSYIRNHIDELAFVKSRLPYGVTDITFDGPNRAIVQYSNGTNAYTAVATASIDTAGNVRILSFTGLDK